jgi:hypothetical protein
MAFFAGEQLNGNNAPRSDLLSANSQLIKQIYSNN